MKNENLLDQFFLIDQNIVELIVDTAEIENNDLVLEIGAGNGIVTKELLKKAGKTIVVEIDRQFEGSLKKIDGKLQIIFTDALKVLEERRIKFTKIVGSLPSSIVEPLIHLLTKTDFVTAVFLLPLKFTAKLINNSSFLTYFDFSIVRKVTRRSFSPVPRTNWAVVKITRKPDALLANDEERFLRQYVYEHPNAKKENALKEGLIKYYKAHNKSLTKKEAKKIITTKNPPAKSAGGF